MAENSGLKSALALLPPGSAAQKDMFGSSSAARRRGRGRPPGSPNKRKFALPPGCADAIALLSSIAASTPAEIARITWVSRDVAMRIWFDAIKELASYQAPKRAALKVEGSAGSVELNIHLGNGASAEPSQADELFPTEGELIEAESAVLDAQEKTQPGKGEQ